MTSDEFDIPPAAVDASVISGAEESLRPRRRPRPQPGQIAAPADHEVMAGQMHENFVFMQRQLRLMRMRQHTLEQARAKLLKHNQHLESQLASIDAERTVLADEHAALAADRAALQAREHDLQQQRSALDTLREQTQQRADDLRRRQEQLEHRGTNLDRRAAEIEDAQRHLAADQAMLQQALADAAALRQQLQLQRDEVEQWLRRLQDQQQAMQTRELALDDREAALARRADAVEQAARQQLDAAARFDALQQEIDRTRANLADEEQRHRQRHADLTRRAAGLVALEEQLAERSRQLDDRAARIERAQQTPVLSLLLALDDGSVREIPVASPVCLVGRDAASDLRLQAPSISRAHCLLYHGGGRWHLRDLGSTNGVYINDQRVTDSPVAAGDVLAIGEVMVTARISGKPRRAASPAVPAALLKRITVAHPAAAAPKSK